MNVLCIVWYCIVLCGVMWRHMHHSALDPCTDSERIRLICMGKGIIKDTAVLGESSAANTHLGHNVLVYYVAWFCCVIWLQSFF